MQSTSATKSAFPLDHPPSEKFGLQTESGFWRTARTNSKLRRHSSPIQVISRDRPIPLSYNQERLWSLEILQDESSVYNLLHTLHLSGGLNREVLQQTLEAIVQRHEILRTTFSTVDEKVVQVIIPDVVVDLPVVDLRSLPANQQEQAVHDLAIADAEQPFNLNQCPLWRFKLVQLSDTDHILIRTIHHIIFDGGSHGVFMREFGMFYTAFAAGEPSPLLNLPVQYADVAYTERQQDEPLAVRLAYWQQQLSGPISALELPLDRPRPAFTSYQGACQSFELSQDITEGLKVLSYQRGVSLFVTLFSAFNVLLHSFTQQTDLLICSPVAGRHRSEIKGLIGYFNNLLVMRSNLSDDPSFQEVLQRVSQMSIDAYEYQDAPIQRVAELPSLARIPLTRAMFVLQNTPNPTLKLGDLRVTSEFVNRAIANFDMSLSMEEKAGRLTGALQYKTELFCPETIAYLVQRFEQLLEQLILNPEQKLSDLARFGDSEKKLYNRSEQETNTTARAAYVAPRNPLEQQLTQIWEEVLEVSPIGIQDNFFELGGHSLSAVTLWVQIEKHLNKKLPITTLLQSPTIQDIAQRLCTATSEEVVEDLVPLRSGGNKPPLFCIYGILLYRELVDQLDADQPVYGVYVQEEVDLLKSGKPAQNNSTFSNVSSIATRYLQAIRKRQPHGPYYFAGESFGGLVALEMAQQLQALGEEVALVSLLDSLLPNACPRLRLIDRLKLHGQLLLQQKSSYIRGLVQKKLQKLHQKLVSQFAKIQQQIHASDAAHSSEAVVQDVRQEFRELALQSYHPPTYSGKVLLFRALERDPFEVGLSHDLGWGQFLEDLHVFDIPGDHLTILQSPNVQIMANILQAHI